MTVEQFEANVGIYGSHERTPEGRRRSQRHYRGGHLSKGVATQARSSAHWTATIPFLQHVFKHAQKVDGNQMIPFVKLFQGSLSVYLWEDDMGDTHEIVLGEGPSVWRTTLH